MAFITVTQAAEKWGITERRVRVLCAEGKVEGAKLEKGAYLIPDGIEKPLDGRKKKKALISVLPKETDELLSRLKSLGVCSFPDKASAESFFVNFIFTYLEAAETVTKDDILSIIKGTIPKDMKVTDAVKIIGLRDSCIFMKQETKRKARLTVESVIKFNAAMHLDDTDAWGKFRSDNTLHIEHPKLYASTDKIEEALTAMIVTYDMNTRANNPLDCAAAIYLDCLRAAPFTKYNEATASLLMNFVLISNNLPAVVFSKEELKDTLHKTALNSYCITKDIRPMIRIIIDAINKGVK